MKKFILLMLLFGFFIFCRLQESADPMNELKKNAISFNIFGTTPWIGVTYERLLTKNLTVEAGLGVPSIGIGFKVYPWQVKPKKVKFYTGLTAAYVSDAVLFNATRTLASFYLVYLPIGFGFYGKRGFNLGVDFGPSLNIFSRDDFDPIPWFGIKLGRRF